MEFHYLPTITLNSIKELVYNNDLSPLYKELETQKYERVGLDRVYMILNDIMINYGRVSGYSILDVGCNNGLFSDVFSCYGNYVTGIDNFAIDRQNRYDSLSFSPNSISKFKQTDIYDFITDTSECYDFIFLLSVAHQWEFGYAHTGDYKIDEEKISYIIDSLFERTINAIYYECPVDEPGFSQNYGIDFLSKYLKQYKDASIVKISDTIASNGYIRSLYRITRSSSEYVNILDKDKNFEKIVCLQNTYGIEGDIVTNGNSEKTKYAIYDGKSITTSIKANERDYSHPWGIQKNRGDVLALWEKVKSNQLEYVVNIEKLYFEEYAQIEIVQGLPCMLTPQIPNWQRLKYYEPKIYNNKFSFSILAQMCLGLAELHALGLAHGDPYPYNVICDGQKLKWIDLGNLSSDMQEIRKDIATFFLYTFPYILFHYGKISYRMIELIEKEVQGNENIQLIMKNVAVIFIGKYTDEKDIDKQDIPFIFKCVNSIVGKYIGSEQQYLLCYQAYKYHTDSIIWMKACNINSEAHKFAELANQFGQFENKRTRISQDMHLDQITYYERQISSLQQSVKELEEGVAYKETKIACCERQISSFQQSVKELEKKITLQEEEATRKETELYQTIDTLKFQNNQLHENIAIQQRHIGLLIDTITQYEKIFQV